MLSRIQSLGSCLIVLTLLLFAGSAAAQDISPRCEAAMDLAAGDYSRCLLRADAHYARHENLSKLENRQARCETRFDRRTTRAINRHGADECASTDLVAALADRTVSYAEGIASETHGGEGLFLSDVMTEQSLLFTRNILDTFLKEKFGLSDRIALINDLIDPNGVVPSINENKVVITLIHIGRFSIDLLITSHFNDYNESLKFIDSTIAFFQENTDVDSLNHPDMPDGINRIEFHFKELDNADLYALWSVLGANYRPSVVYNLRLVDMNAN